MKHWIRQGLLLAWIATWVVPLHAYNPANREEYQAKIKEAKKVFDDRCKNVAGAKIYNTVPEVEGVLLMKVRPVATNLQLSDPMWPGAAFGNEDRGDSYLRSFLGYENGRVTKTRGYINTDRHPDSLPGYRWVEVIDPKDGQRYRYTGSVKAVRKQDTTAYHVRLAMSKDPNYDLNVYEWSLDKTLSPSRTPPRYAVTFEDHVIPEERALWLASSTIKVLDLKTDEVLAEWTRYAMSYIHLPRVAAPWLNASICPSVPGASGQNTRQFVDQILMPKKDQ